MLDLAGNALFRRAGGFLLVSSRLLGRSGARGAHWAWLCVLVVAASRFCGLAGAQGIPELDPAQETLIVGPNVPVPAVAALGDWSAEPGRVALVATDNANQNYWMPQVDAAQGFVDGFVRARFDVGERLDSSVLFRVDVAPDKLAGLSGYGLSLARDEVLLERWDKGVVVDLGEKVKVKKLPKLAVVEVTIWVVGPQIVAAVYDGESLTHLATLVVTDTTHGSGAVGLRAYGKQDAKSALRLLSVRGAGRRGEGERGPSGDTRYVELRRSVLGKLPDGVRAREIEARGDDRVLVALTRTGLERLRRSGVEVLGVERDGKLAYVDERYRAERGKPPTPTETGFRLDLSYKDAAMVEALLRGYHARYPKITALVELGRSHRGWPVLALKISDHPDEDEDEPSLLLNAAHHGVELLSTEFALDAVQILLERYGEDRAVRRWVDGLEIWVVPLVNPDALDLYVNSSMDAGRKNGRDLDRDGEFEPSEGVDLNRNYPFHWHRNGEVASSSLERHRWFRGWTPGSEPETQALMRLVDSERPVAAISYHTWGGVILVPYTAESAQNPEPNAAWTIAEELAAAAGEQANGRAYRVKRNMYAVDGVDQDWFRAAHGTVALLVEGVFHTPRDPLKREDTIARNRPTWMTLLDRALDGPSIYGHVVDADGKPLVATITLDEETLREGEHWTSRCRDGRFERMVPAPGRYTVRATLPGLETLSRSVQVKAGHRARADFVFDGKPSADLEALLCPDPAMCSVETVCAARAGQCVRPGLPAHCLLDGACLTEGAAVPARCGVCDPRLAVEWTPAAVGTLCGHNRCDGGVVEHAGTCDASGECQQPAPVSCAPYAACGEDGACASRCDTDDDCLEGPCAHGVCGAGPAPQALAAATSGEAGPTASSAPTDDKEGGCAASVGAAPCLSWELWTLLAVAAVARRRALPRANGVG